MEAAEKLVAKNGIHNVSIKEIVREASQKNESVLQYHFKNFQGLIDAIHRRRSGQTRDKRAEMLAELQSTDARLSLRDLCQIMVMPTYLLAKTDTKYRRYVSAFGHEVATTPESALSVVNKAGGGGKSGEQTGGLLRTALTHLDEIAYRQRMDLATRMTSAAIGHHARQKNAFRGPEAELFVSDLIDALEGLLGAPVSSETRALR